MVGPPDTVNGSGAWLHETERAEKCGQSGLGYKISFKN